MQLSHRQQNTLATALTILAGLVILSAVLGVFWLLALFLGSFSRVFLPVAVAGIAAMVFQPYYDWLQTRLPVPLALAALFLSVLVPAGAFFGFFGVVIVRQLDSFFAELPVWWNHLVQKLQQYGPEVHAFFTTNPTGIKLAQVLRGQGPMLAAGLEYITTTSMAAGLNIAAWTGAMLGWAITPVYFAFFLLMKRHDVAQLEGWLPFLKEGTRKDVLFLAREFVNIIVAFFRGQIIIAFLQGLLLAIGFSFVGLKYGLVLGFLLGFLNVIPYLGSMLGLAITLPLAYFQHGGGLLTLAGVAIVLALVQTIEGYVLTPRIMGKRTGLHPMVIIFAVFFWGSALNGILGMILAIPLTAFLVVFWRLAKEKYIPELV